MSTTTSTIELVPISSQTHNPNNEASTETAETATPPSNAAEAIPDGGYGWAIVGACSFLLMLINGYTTSWGVLQTALLKSGVLQTDIQTVTFVGSLYMACMVAFGPVAVRLMDAFGLRVTSLLAVSLFGLGLICTSFTLGHLGGLFCVTGVCLGLGTCLLYTATNSLPTQWFSGRLGLANGLVKMGGGIGATVMPVAAQALIDRFGLEWAFRVLGFVVLITGIPCALMLQGRIPAGRPSRFEWGLLKNPPFLSLALAGAIGVFALFVPPFFLPLFASSIGLSPATGAGLVAGFGASTTVGRLAGGWLSDKIGAFNALALTALVNSLSMLAIWPVSDTVGPLFVFAIVNGCANGSFFTGIPTAVAALAPGSAAASISLMITFWTPGYLLGPPLAGILIQATGAEQASSIVPYRAAIFYAAGTGVAATILIVLSRMRLDRKLIKKL